MSHRVLIASLITSLIIWGCGGSVVTPPQGVVIHESATDQRITEGETTIEVEPDAAYAAVTNYDLWPATFADIEKVVITSRAGDDARVTFIKPDGNRDNLHFHNRPTSRTVWFEDTGGAAEVWAEIAFAPGNDAGTTRVRTRLFAEVHGAASLFVGDSKVREMRQRKVAGVLRDLRAYFGPR